MPSNVNAIQSQLALNLGNLQLNQQNRERAIKLMFIQQFIQRITEERARKKQAARAETAQGQKQAANAGAILASLLTGGAATPSLLAVQDSPGVSQGIQQFQSGNQSFGLDQILALVDQENRRRR